VIKFTFKYLILFGIKTGSENKPTTSTNLYFGTRRFGTIQLTFANYLAQYKNNIMQLLDNEIK
jgi:hypothetical protein